MDKNNIAQPEEIRQLYWKAIDKSIFYLPAHLGFNSVTDGFREFGIVRRLKISLANIGIMHRIFTAF